jgi:hypothetical protein
VLTLAHIIHPGVVDPASDLVIAQPITFESMRIARDFAAGRVDVNLYAIQHHDEERLALPGCFVRTPDLTRSVGDIKAFAVRRKLALLKDILDALYAADPADYLIYTNVDIALLPHFYWMVSQIIAQGYDAFAINRRTIPGKYKSVDEIPLMYAELGEPHPGWDCFVFRRDLYPAFDLGTACIGISWIGRVIITNMAALARKFRVFEDLHLTFHIGDSRVWQSSRFQDYQEHNRNESKRVLVNFDRIYGPFDRKELPGRFFHQLEREEKS